MAAKVNYTDAMVATAVEMYNAGGNASIEEIATTLGKTSRSVISKLVREGVYVADVKAPAKAKDEGPTKKEMLAELMARAPSVPVDGLNGATKEAIQWILDAVPTAEAE